MLKLRPSSPPRRVNETDLPRSIPASAVRRANPGLSRLRGAARTTRRTSTAPSPCTPSATTRPSPGSPAALNASSCPTNSTSQDLPARSPDAVRDRAKRPAISSPRYTRIAGSIPRRPSLENAIKEYGDGIRDQCPRSTRSDRRQLGPIRAGPDPARRQGRPVEFRFRNGNKVTFEAHAIKVPSCSPTSRRTSRPARDRSIRRRSTSPRSAIASSSSNQKQYLGDKVGQVEHGPETAAAPPRRPRHRHHAAGQAGAYLVTAQMDNGNISRIIVWISDTAIVKKQLEGRSFYYVADAVTGLPVPEADAGLLRLDRWQVECQQRTQYKVVTTLLRGQDQHGRPVRLGDEQADRTIISGSSPPARPGRARQQRSLRLSRLHRRLVRPALRRRVQRRPRSSPSPIGRSIGPTRQVHFKFWVRHAKYDQPDVSDFAGKQFTVAIHNPKGEKVYDKTITSRRIRRLRRRFRAAQGRHARRLPAFTARPDTYGGGSFRVEEYKKPEFEVKVEAPKEPVMLGEKITATIKAKYYFGAPVTERQGQVQGRCAPATPPAGIRAAIGTGSTAPATGGSPATMPGIPAGATGAARRPTPWWWPGLAGTARSRAGKRGADRPRRQGQGDDRHAPAKELHGDRTTVHDHRRGRGRIAPHHRRHRQRARRAQAVQGLCLGGSRPLSRRRHGHGLLRRPDARTASRSRARAN